METFIKTTERSSPSKNPSHQPMIKASHCIQTSTCKIFLKAEPGGPPSREYKQSMAMYETSPHPSPVKRKLNKGG